MSSIVTRDIAGVKKVWEMHEKPCFSIWENSKYPAFTCSDDEESKREEMLNDSLNFIRDGGTTAVYTIKFHEQPGKGKINANTPAIGSLNFRLNDVGAMPEKATAGGSNMDLMNKLFEARLQNFELRVQYQMDKKDEEIALLKQQLKEAEEQEMEEYEEEDDGLGAIGSLLKAGERYPQLKELIDMGTNFLKDAIVVGKHKFNQATHQQPAGSIAGVNVDQAPDKIVNESIAKMFHYYVKKYGEKEGGLQFAKDMAALANLTDDDEVFQLAIKKLRSF